MMLRSADFIVPDPRNLPENAHLPTVNKPETIIGVTAFVLTLACLAICLRTWVRVRNNILGLDDVFVLLAGMSSIYGDVFVCIMPQTGLGLHLWTLDNKHLEGFFKHVYITNTSYVSSAAFIKLAVLLQYLRLFAEPACSTSISQCRLARRLTYFLLTLSSIWGVIFTLIAFFPCSPIEKNWNPDVPGKCFGWGTKVPDFFFPMFVGHAASNTLLDLIVLLLPFPFLGTIRLGQRGKVGFVLLYTLGCIVSALSIGRMIALSSNRAGTVPILDMSYFTPTVYLFSILEVNIAIVAACIPIFWPVITGLAANKIFVLNEVDIQVEQVSRRSSFGSGRGMPLVPRGTWKDDGIDPFGKTDPYQSTDPYGGRTSRLSLVPKAYDRSASQGSHRHQRSNASSLGRHMGLEFGRRRSSEESLRCLHRSASNGNVSLKGSINQESTTDYFLEVDKDMSGGKTTTTVARTEVPIDHIQALNDRQRL